MFIPADQDAVASTVLPITESSASQQGVTQQDVNQQNVSEPEKIRHLLFGSLSAIRTSIHTLHKQGYACVKHC
jgi:hypothetical protein